jgi:hypothetical protein
MSRVRLLRGPAPLGHAGGSVARAACGDGRLGYVVIAAPETLLLGPLYEVPGAYPTRAMPDREPQPWESGAAGPFLWIEGSLVEVWALGGPRRTRICPPG